VKISVPFVREAAEAGDTATEPTVAPNDAAVTFTVADADLVGSAVLVAVTTHVVALVGAVYSPEDVILPTEAAQVTGAFLVHRTLAANCIFVPGASEAEDGETVTCPFAAVLLAASPAHPDVQSVNAMIAVRTMTTKTVFLWRAVIARRPLVFARCGNTTSLSRRSEGIRLW
jgi:hypothetical protein